MRKSFTIRIDSEELERLDAACGPIPRERFVRDAIEAAVRRAERGGIVINGIPLAEQLSNQVPRARKVK